MIGFGYREQDDFHQRLSKFANRYQVQIRHVQKQAEYTPASKYWDRTATSIAESAVRYCDQYELTVTDRNLEYLIKTDEQWRDIVDAAQRNPAVKDAYEQLLTVFHLTRPQYER